MSETQPPRPEWPTQAADTIVRYVDQIKVNTTDRALTVAKTVVFGLFAAILGILLGLVALLGIFRAVDQLRDLVVADSVWLTYVVLGVIFVVIGQFVFARRKRTS